MYSALASLLLVPSTTFLHSFAVFSPFSWTCINNCQIHNITYEINIKNMFTSTYRYIQVQNEILIFKTLQLMPKHMKENEIKNFSFDLVECKINQTTDADNCNLKDTTQGSHHFLQKFLILYNLKNIIHNNQHKRYKNVKEIKNCRKDFGKKSSRIY